MSEDAITAEYTNWRGETRERTFVPQRVLFGANEWHPQPQVLIEAIDCESGKTRTFAAAGFYQPDPDRALAEAAKIAGLVSDNGEASAVQEAIMRVVVDLFQACRVSAKSYDAAMDLVNALVKERDALRRDLADANSSKSMKGE